MYCDRNPTTAEVRAASGLAYLSDQLATVAFQSVDLVNTIRMPSLQKAYVYGPSDIYINVRKSIYHLT